MRFRRLLVATGLALVVVAPATASSGGAGCAPNGGWNLLAVSDVLTMLGLTEAPPSMDGNGDGMTCVRFQELANGNKGWTAVIYADNNVR